MELKDEPHLRVPKRHQVVVRHRSKGATLDSDPA
jgi:hypothetical protein